VASEPVGHAPPVCAALAACGFLVDHHRSPGLAPFVCLTPVALLDQVGSVSLRLEWTYANHDQDASITDEIAYTYTIINDGLLTLYNIAVEDIAVEGLASYPSNGLAPAESLACSATGSVSRAEVRSSRRE